MEARTAFRGSGISKSMVAIVAAVLAAFALGSTGGYFAKSLSETAAPASAHVAAAQTIQAPAPASASLSGSFREPGTRRGGIQIAP